MNTSIGKYSINYTDEDTKTWFINSYLHKWVKDNYPEAEKEAENKFAELSTPKKEKLAPAY